MTRAFVTGIGAITPIGLTAHDFWANLVAGVSGVTTITRFDSSNLPVHIAAEVKGFDDKLAAIREENRTTALRRGILFTLLGVFWTLRSALSLRAKPKPS